MNQAKLNGLTVEAIDEMVQKWMHMQVFMLRKMFQDMTSKVAFLEEMRKIVHEFGVIGNAIDIVESKFDVYTNSLELNIKKLASIFESHTEGHVRLLSIQFRKQAQLARICPVGRNTDAISDKLSTEG